MSDAHVTAEERYESLCRTLLNEPAVTRESDITPHRTGFGSLALKVDDNIFAMLVKGWLVVKLPQHRVDALVALGEGERYDPGGGRLMKEWVTVGPQAEVQWLDLAREAQEFAARRSAA
jgi:TfoX/Sxy family transcriptional regulator of competence genes